MSELKELCKEFISILDIVEISEGGYEFYPNRISSCRVMDGQRLSNILIMMKEIVNE